MHRSEFPNTEDVYDVPWIHTQYGRFNLLEPHFDERAIAHSLGQLARFNGHASRFYSVAEHSILVASLMSTLNLGDPFWKERGGRAAYNRRCGHHHHHHHD